MSRAWMIYGANGYTGELIAREGRLVPVPRVLEMHRASGHLTPAQLVGRDFVEQLPGSGPVRIEAASGG
ncbi:MAG: hypothetical protein ACNA8G_01905 [Gammaproteobacteria bacterium]